jgi:hypothetical protein
MTLNLPRSRNQQRRNKMAVSLGKLQDIKKESSKLVEFEFYDHKFKMKFLSEKEEQEVMSYVSDQDFDGYVFMSKLETMQAAASTVEIDGETIYDSDSPKLEDVLEVVEQYESWDSDVFNSFSELVRQNKKAIKEEAARKLGFTQEEVEEYLNNSESTIEKITSKAVELATDVLALEDEDGGEESSPEDTQESETVEGTETSEE